MRYDWQQEREPYLISFREEHGWQYAKSMRKSQSITAPWSIDLINSNIKHGRFYCIEQYLGICQALCPYHQIHLSQLRPCQQTLQQNISRKPWRIHCLSHTTTTSGSSISAQQIQHAEISQARTVFEKGPNCPENLGNIQPAVITLYPEQYNSDYAA